MAKAIATRPDPEQLLRQVQAEEQHETRGRLKIFLGYSSGVGKSRRMHDEGRRRRERGQDVVVGATQPVSSPEVDSLLKKMEVIPLKTFGGTPVMDVDSILVRRPQVCIVDGLAYNNPPGSRQPERWQDVEEILAAGISVIGSVNLQHIEEIQDQVERITGKRATETIPSSFLYSTDEIEVVDAPPELCLERREGAEGADVHSASLQRQLSELREIALVLVADIVDRQLESYLKRHEIEPLWGVHERILVFLDPRVDGVRMIESGRRNRDRFHGELIVAYVNRPDLLPEERARLESNLALARQLGAQIEPLDGEDPVETIMRFARARGITQIFVGRAAQENWWERLSGGDVDRLIREAEGIDVRVFPH